MTGSNSKTRRDNAAFHSSNLWSQWGLVVKETTIVLCCVKKQRKGGTEEEGAWKGTYKKWKGFLFKKWCQCGTFTSYSQSNLVSHLLLGPKQSQPLDMWWPLWPRRRYAALHPPIPSAPCLSSGWRHSSLLQTPVTSSLECMLPLSLLVRQKKCLWWFQLFKKWFNHKYSLFVIGTIFNNSDT